MYEASNSGVSLLLGLVANIVIVTYFSYPRLDLFISEPPLNVSPLRILSQCVNEPSDPFADVLNCLFRLIILVP
jgi:hypothetical protein